MKFDLFVDRLVMVWQRDSVSVEANSIEEAVDDLKIQIAEGAVDCGYDDSVECDETNFVMETIQPVTDNNGNEVVEILDNENTLWKSKGDSVLEHSDKLFRHNKTGNYYYVICEGMHTETQEDFVVYVALYDDNKIYVRPKSMFYEDVVINGKKMKRFEPAPDDQEGIKRLAEYYKKLEY